MLVDGECLATMNSVFDSAFVEFILHRIDLVGIDFEVK